MSPDQAVPTARAGALPARVRVTVVGPDERAELSLPSQTPIKDLLGALIQFSDAGQPTTPLRTWHLVPEGRGPIPPGSTLAEAAVADSAVLFLREAHATASVALHPGIGPRANAVLGAAIAWLLVSLTYLGTNPLLWGSVGPTTAVVGAFLLALSKGRADHPAPLRFAPSRAARILLGWSAVPFFALSSALAPGPINADLEHATYGLAGAGFGIVLAMVCAPHAGILTGALFSLGTAVLVTTGTALGEPALAAVGAALVSAPVTVLSSRTTDLALAALVAAAALFVLLGEPSALTSCVAGALMLVLAVRCTMLAAVGQLIWPLGALAAGLFGLVVIWTEHSAKSAPILLVVIASAAMMISAALVVRSGVDQGSSEQEQP